MLGIGATVVAKQHMKVPGSYSVHAVFGRQSLSRSDESGRAVLTISEAGVVQPADRGISFVERLRVGGRGRQDRPRECEPKEGTKDHLDKQLACFASKEVDRQHHVSFEVAR